MRHLTTSLLLASLTITGWTGTTLADSTASGNERGELDFAGEQRDHSVEWREF